MKQKLQSTVQGSLQGLQGSLQSARQGLQGLQGLHGSVRNSVRASVRASMQTPVHDRQGSLHGGVQAQPTALTTEEQRGSSCCASASWPADACNMGQCM